MKSLLLGSSTLMAFSFVAAAAHATCSTTTPMTGEGVTCTGANATPIIAAPGATNVQLTLDGTAALTTPTPAIKLYGGSHVILQTGAYIHTTGNYSYGIRLSGSNNIVDVYGNSTSGISTAGVGADAISNSGDNVRIGVTGAAIDMTGDSAIGITQSGSGAVTLTGSQITSHGDVSDGVFTHNATTVTLNDTLISTFGSGGGGMNINGQATVATLNGTSLISINGTASYGVFLQTENGRLTLNGRSEIVAGSTATDGDGLRLSFANNMHIQLNDTARIITRGDRTDGIDVRTYDNTLQFNNNSGIQVYGQHADGIRLDGRGNSVDFNQRGFVTARGRYDNAIDVISGQHRINLNYNNALISYGTDSNGLYLRAAATNTSLLLDNASTLIASGANSNALYSKADGVQAILTGSSFIEARAGNSVGAKLMGNGDAITLNGSAHIAAVGSSIAFQSSGIGNALTLNEGSSVSTSGATTEGVLVTNALNRITLNDNSHILTTGSQSIGIVLNTGGDYTSVALSGTSGVQVNSDTSTALAVASDHNTIALSGMATISSLAANSRAALISGTDNHLILTDTSRAASSGDNSTVIDLAGTGNHIDLYGDSSIRSSSALVGPSAANAVLIEGNQVTLSLHDRSVISGLGDDTVLLVGAQNNLNILDHGMIMQSGAGLHAIAISGQDNRLHNFGTILSQHGTALLGSNNPLNGDLITNAGLIMSGDGFAPINLRTGDDELTLSTGSQIVGGDIDGGDGQDTLTLLGIGAEDNRFVNFEQLVVDAPVSFVAAATDFALSGNSDFNTSIDVRGGRLRVDGSIGSIGGTTVGAAGSLGGTGTLRSNVVSTGHLSPGDFGAGTLTIAGNLTQTGGALDVKAGGQGVSKVVVQGAAGATLAGAPALNITPLGGSTGGAQSILHADNGITGSFGAVNFIGNGAATVTQTATDVQLMTVSGTPIAASDFAAAEAGLDFVDTIGTQQLAGLDLCGDDHCALPGRPGNHLWATGFGHFGSEQARNGDLPFDYTVAGTAIGGDIKLTPDIRIGVSGGYSNTEQNVDRHAASADIDTGQIGLYANWQHGPFFVTGLLSGGYQSLDLSRDVDLGGATGSADATSHGWLFGSTIQAGAQFTFPQGWRLTPSAAISYQHQWANGYKERGGGFDDVTVRSHQSDAMRLRAQLQIENDIPVGNVVVTPHLKVGAEQQVHLGGKATGIFSTGEDFAISLKNETRTVGLAGAGINVSFENGLSTFVDYDGRAGSGAVIHAVTGGIRYSW